MRNPFWRVGVFIAAAIWPSLWFYQAFADLLGPDPGKVLVDRLGLGTLVLLLITLSMTPLQKLTGWTGWIAVRRQLGLWCFAYVVLHLCSYMAFILGFDWSQLTVELRKRPDINVGANAQVGPPLPPYFYTVDRDRRARMVEEAAIIGSDASLRLAASTCCPTIL